MGAGGFQTQKGLGSTWPHQPKSEESTVFRSLWTRADWEHERSSEASATV